MATAPEMPWVAVGQRIEKRIDELKLTAAEVLRGSGISSKTLSGYIAGKPIRRRDKERGLCEALAWTPDSIERMLRGEEPIAASDAGYDRPSLEERVTLLESELAEVKLFIKAATRPQDMTRDELAALSQRQADAHEEWVGGLDHAPTDEDLRRRATELNDR